MLVSEADTAAATVVLGHGAGGGAHARDLAALARALPPIGVTVIRVEQPWRVAGRRVAPRPPVLDQGWLAVLEAVDAEEPLIVGGRSAGARVACRTAVQTGAAGVVCLAFPLHPPGKPERSRYEELAVAGVPALVLQGERDAFGRPEEFPDGRFTLVPVGHADHSMAVPKGHDQKRALDQVVTAAAAWIGNVLGVQLR